MAAPDYGKNVYTALLALCPDWNTDKIEAIVHTRIEEMKQNSNVVVSLGNLRFG